MPADEAHLGVWADRTISRSQDLFYGPWGLERAPDPDATYRSWPKKQGGAIPA